MPSGFAESGNPGLFLLGIRGTAVVGPRLLDVNFLNDKTSIGFVLSDGIS